MRNLEANHDAVKKVKTKRGFYIHLSIYVVVNILLIIINLISSSEYLWFKWPLMGWSIGIIVHALRVFVQKGKTTNTDQSID